MSQVQTTQDIFFCSNSSYHVLKFGSVVLISNGDMAQNVILQWS